MRLSHLALSEFGPFKHYTIPLALTNRACLLLTGRNNEGKSNIILGLRLLDAATRVLGSRRQELLVDGEYCYRLLTQDVGNLTVGRLVHNYEDEVGSVVARFVDGLEITVFVNPALDLIYANHVGRLPAAPDRIFGFIPPLGPVADPEERLTEKHVRANLLTSLAPRHLRNHLLQILDPGERKLVRDLIRSSWEGVELLDVEYDVSSNRLSCFYREARCIRELAWAGQGLQVWVQILTHMVRLRDTDILVLDEPEINLHAERQHDLIRLLREHHRGSVLIATHSVELMNDVHVSHIIHVQKDTTGPSIKSTQDRHYLDRIRAKIGSGFNLIASQFESVDAVLFTEDRSDFKLIQQLLKERGESSQCFNIPLHGFSEYPKAAAYREAYVMLIGRDDTRFVAVLDRDYYPETYRERVIKDLEKAGVNVAFTPGKEIENLFLIPEVVAAVVGDKHMESWLGTWNRLFEDEYLDALGTVVKLACEFGPSREDPKTVMKRVKPLFDRMWEDPNSRHRVLPGKKGLATLRTFYQQRYGRSLYLNRLISALAKQGGVEMETFLAEIATES